MIKACDKALQKKEEALKASQEASTEAKSLSANLKVKLEDSEEKLNNPTRNPFFMLGVGATAGLIVGGPIVMGLGLVAGLLFQ